MKNQDTTRTPACERCMFSFKKENDLFCYRNPPTPFLVQAMAASLASAKPVAVFQVRSADPPVPPNHWCGEYVPKVQLSN